MIEYVPIYRLPQETELEGWAEVIERDRAKANEDAARDVELARAKAAARLTTSHLKKA